jgi:hypothetical protein
VVEYVGWILLANLVMVVMVERRSRQLQWETFNRAVRDCDAACRKAGWILSSWEFHPGWRWGRGSLTWRKDEVAFVGDVKIDAMKTTREAAHPW